MELFPIENEILLLYAKNYENGKYKETFLSQIKCIEDVRRDFTGQGVFVSFKIKKENCNFLKIDNIDIRIDGLFLHSNELLHECPISIVIKKGILDYIEFEYGFKDTKYPKVYELKWGNFNLIEDK